MSRVPLGDSFTDDRGEIQDILSEQIDAVTLIHSFRGAIRGNHFHRETIQWTYVVSGSLLATNGQTEMLVTAGEMIVDHPGVPHAWRAMEDTDCLVFTKGPRSGAGYESDTHRLDEPLFS